MAHVKICGLTDPDIVAFAASAGADWIGFMFPAASPRCISLDQAARLMGLTGTAKPVAVLADPDDAEVMAVAELGFAVLQLHGQETPARLATIKRMTGCEVWKAIGVAAQGDLAQAEDYACADRLLIDAKPPEGAPRTGGHGRAIDWRVLAGWRPPKPWLLAGGLTPDNVAEAIRLTGAPAVDVSSGVERAPRIKDAELIGAFVRAAKGP